MSRLHRTIELTLIESENMTISHNSNELNGIMTIEIVPSAYTERSIHDLLELNLMGTGIHSYNINSVIVDQEDTYSDHNIRFKVPSVRVTVEDRQHNMFRDVITAARTIQPADLLDDYEEIINEKN